MTDSPFHLTKTKREALLLEKGEWRLLDAVDWIVHEGRRQTELGVFLESLCNKLLELGAPLWRVRFAFRTLHPQMFAQSSTWTRGEKVSVYAREHGVEQTTAFVGSPIEYVYTTGKPFRRSLLNLQTGRDHRVLMDLAKAGGTDYLAHPLVFSTSEVSALFIAVTDRPGGFCDRDLSKLSVLSDYLAPLVQVFSTRHAARSLLDTYVGPRTGDRVLRGLIKRGDVETIQAALWFSDLRDSTKLAEQLSARDLLDTLNRYFELVADAVGSRGGEILRFIGDAMLIVFAEDHTGLSSPSARALEAARDAFDALESVNQDRAGDRRIRFGVGLHVGEVIYGNVGAPNRLDFTVTGPAVNRTARLESLTKELGHELLMSAEFVRDISTPVRSLGRHLMKGVPEPQEVFALNDESLG